MDNNGLALCYYEINSFNKYKISGDLKDLKVLICGNSTNGNPGCPINYKTVVNNLCEYVQPVLGVPIQTTIIVKQLEPVIQKTEILPTSPELSVALIISSIFSIAKLVFFWL